MVVFDFVVSTEGTENHQGNDGDQPESGVSRPGNDGNHLGNRGSTQEDGGASGARAIPPPTESQHQAEWNNLETPRDDLSQAQDDLLTASDLAPEYVLRPAQDDCISAPNPAPDFGNFPTHGSNSSPRTEAISPPTAN